MLYGYAGELGLAVTSQSLIPNLYHVAFLSCIITYKSKRDPELLQTSVHWPEYL